jgi:hypothetical protein
MKFSTIKGLYHLWAYIFLMQFHFLELLFKLQAYFRPISFMSGFNIVWEKSKKNGCHF